MFGLSKSSTSGPNQAFSTEKIIELSQDIPPHKHEEVIRVFARENNPDNIEFLADVICGFMTKCPTDAAITELSKLLEYRVGTLISYHATRAFSGCVAPLAFKILTDALLSSRVPGEFSGYSIRYWNAELASSLNCSLKILPHPETITTLLASLEVKEPTSFFTEDVIQALSGLNDRAVKEALKSRFLGQFE